MVVGDIPQALRYLMAHCPDLIITDFHLPSGTGNELISYIRRQSTLQHVPILGISVDDTWRSEAMGRGASAFMTKPIDIFELLSTSRVLLTMPLEATQPITPLARPVHPERPTGRSTGRLPQDVITDYRAAYNAVYHRTPDCYWTGRHYLIDKQRCDEAWLLSETERLHGVANQPTHPRNALLRLIDKIRKI